MDIRYSLRPLDQAILDSYPRLFPEEPDKTPELLDWRFERNPHGQGRFAVAEQGEKLVGLIGLVATRLRSGGETWRAFQAIDTVVDPVCRGKGVFVGLGKAAQDPASLGGQVLWGFPNANAARGWYGRLGWRNFGAVPMLIRPLRTGFPLARLHPSLRAFDVRLQGRRPQLGDVYADRERFERDSDALWRRRTGQEGIAVDRSGDWLRWRLMDKPGVTYRCAGSDRAIVATRVADKHGGRIAYVMEALGELADLAPLLQGELSAAADEGAEVALAWCPRHAVNYGAYRKAGFVPFPARLRPIEINFGARALRDEAKAAEQSGSWYVSYLDSDTV